MPLRHHLMIPTLALLLCACFSTTDTKGNQAGVCANAETGTVAGVIVGSSHSGHRDACCADCHTPDAHNEGLGPHECSCCHGTNGARGGHGGGTPCGECHGQSHTCAEIPDPEGCETCHPG